LAGTHAEVRAYDMNESADVTTFPVEHGVLGVEDSLSLAASPAGNLLLVGTHYSSNVRVLSLPTGGEPVPLGGRAAGVPLLRRNAVRAVALSHDGHLALSGSNDGTARVWAVRSGEEVCRFEGHAGWWGIRGITGVAFLPDGERALSCCEDGTLCLWEARSG